MLRRWVPPRPHPRTVCERTSSLFNVPLHITSTVFCCSSFTCWEIRPFALCVGPVTLLFIILRFSFCGLHRHAWLVPFHAPQRQRGSSYLDPWTLSCDLRSNEQHATTHTTFILSCHSEYSRWKPLTFQTKAAAKASPSSNPSRPNRSMPIAIDFPTIRKINTAPVYTPPEPLSARGDIPGYVPPSPLLQSHCVARRVFADTAYHSS